MKFKPQVRLVRTRLHKMRVLLEWMATDSYVRALPVLLACICFGKNGPGRLLKGVRSTSIETCKEGISNAAWDLTYLSCWVNEAQPRDPDRLLLFCSADRALLEAGRAFTAPRSVPISVARAALLEKHWGLSHARELGRLLDEMEGRVGKREDYLRERLASLDELQGELDRELAGTFN